MTTHTPDLVPAIVAPDFNSFAVQQAIAQFLADHGDATGVEVPEERGPDPSSRQAW